MSDFTGYTPVYVRSSGNDTTGNGMINTPYATVARAFKHAYFGTSADIVGTEPTQQIMVIQAAGFVAIESVDARVLADKDLTITYYDSTISSFTAHTINSSAIDSFQAATDIANNMPVSSSMYASVSGNNVTIYSGNTGPCPDNTYNGDWFAVSGTLVASQISNTSPVAYIPVAASSNSYVIDVGSGNFNGVNLNNIYSYNNGIYVYTGNWPNRIAVRGAGSSSSNFGGVNGAGTDGLYDYITTTETPATAGKTVTIISDLSVSLGNISTAGGSADSLFSYSGENGGNISLTDCVCGDLNSSGGDATGPSVAGTAGQGGSITLTNCRVTSNVTSSGGSAIDGTGIDAGRSAGALSITDSSITGNVSANGGDGYGAGANITITRSSCGTVSANGGAAANTTGGNDKAGANAGNISITDSICGNISATAGVGAPNYPNGNPGSVTLSGISTLPNIINAGYVNTTNLRKGRGVNGSSILAIV